MAKTSIVAAAGADGSGWPAALTEWLPKSTLGASIPCLQQTASEIAQALGLDPGYLSRTLRGFRRAGFVTGEPGHDRRAREAIGGMLRPLDDRAQQRAVDAMRVIREILGDPLVEPTGDEPFVFRGHRPGDMGWIIH